MTSLKWMEIFQARLGYHFKDKNLLTLALTHASTGDANYERLEFLGDRVLGLAVADILYKILPDESEGGLAKRHAALVCTDTLAQIALTLDLPQAVITSPAERTTGGATQENLLADCMEAIIGGIYLDDGYPACLTLIEALWGERLYTLHQPPIDPKTGLQEWAQERRLPIPTYTVIKKEGPDHAPSFTVSVTLRGFDPAEGIGSSRRNAEKEAARLLLERLEQI